MTTWICIKCEVGMDSEREPAGMIQGHGCLHVWEWVCTRPTTPPYCAGYCPMKATFLPGQRVRRIRGADAHGVIVAALWNLLRKEDWVVFRSNGGDTTCLREDQVQHLPFTRSNS